jgi:hypothetical protein
LNNKELSYNPKNKSNQQYYRIILILMLIIILLYGFYSEKIIVGKGFGWDGGSFGDLTRNIIGYLRLHKVEPYRFQRIAIPFCINIIYRIFKIDFCNENVILTYLYINLACIFLSVYYFFKISNFLKLLDVVEIIGFASLFFCFPTLKLAMFYPVLMDIPAYLIGIMLAYYYLKQETIIAFVLILIGSFIYPTFILFSVLFIFKQQPVLKSNYSDTIMSSNKWKAFINNEKIPYAIFKVLMPILFTLLFFYFFFGANPNRVIKAFQSDFIKTFLLCFSFIIGLLYLSYLNIYDYAIFSIKSIYIALNKTAVILTLGVYLVIKLLINIFASNEPALLTLKDYLINICVQVSQNPFNFFVAHVYYFSLTFLLLIFLIKKYKLVVLSYGFGMMLFISLVVFFSLGNESRQLINYYPFIVILMLITLHKYYNISFTFAIIVVFINLFLSHFWYKINSDNASEKDFLLPNTDSAQRYFMFQGPWVTIYSYTIHLMICACIISLLYLIIKQTKLITHKSD